MLYFFVIFFSLILVLRVYNLATLPEDFSKACLEPFYLF